MNKQTNESPCEWVVLKASLAGSLICFPPSWNSATLPIRRPLLDVFCRPGNKIMNQDEVISF